MGVGRTTQAEEKVCEREEVSGGNMNRIGRVIIGSLHKSSSWRMSN